MISRWAKESLDKYAKDRIPPGGFLIAVLANDLMEAMGRADENNRYNLHDICSYVYNNIPSGCHGSYDIVDAWLDRKEGKA